VGHIYKLAETLYVSSLRYQTLSFLYHSTASRILLEMRSSTRLSITALQFLGLAAAFPSEAVVAPRADAQVASRTYDYVIVGGGITGLIVANRLSEDKRSEFSWPVRLQPWGC
jgi:hypothetical protein